MKTQVIKSYIPMSEASFLLLTCLYDENMHGYGIMQKTSEYTHGRVSLGAGTVYTILSKMVEDGLVEVAEEIERRKVYSITRLGESVFEAECARITEIADIIFKIRRRKADE